jgi:hypothetical protein
MERVCYSETSLNLERTSLLHIAEYRKYNDIRKVFNSSGVTPVSSVREAASQCMVCLFFSLILISLIVVVIVFALYSFCVVCPLLFV